MQLCCPVHGSGLPALHALLQRRGETRMQSYRKPIRLAVLSVVTALGVILAQAAPRERTHTAPPPPPPPSRPSPPPPPPSPFGLGTPPQPKQRHHLRLQHG